jgi:hypothetical protein
MKVKQYSPFVISFEVVEKGNLKQRSTLSKEWENMKPSDDFTSPKIIKKNTFVPKERKKQSSVMYDKNTFFNK